MKALARSWRATLESLYSYLDKPWKDSPRQLDQIDQIDQGRDLEQGMVQRYTETQTQIQTRHEEELEQDQDHTESQTMLPPQPPPKAKILMLHGNGQSGDFFRCKTRFLHGPIIDAFNAASLSNCIPSFSGLQFDYPDGPIPTPPPDTSIFPEEPTTFNWGYGDLSNEGEAVLGAEEAFDAIVHELTTNGPYIGIIAFSAGAALAVVVASLLENQQAGLKGVPRINHPPLSFVIAFGGFVLPNERYEHVYRRKVQTPVLQFIGDVDPLVTEEANMKLMGHCEWGFMVRFFGAHYVPRGRGVAEAVVEFIGDALGWVDRGWVDV